MVPDNACFSVAFSHFHKYIITNCRHAISTATYIILLHLSHPHSSSPFNPFFMSFPLIPLCISLLPVGYVFTVALFSLYLSLSLSLSLGFSALKAVPVTARSGKRTSRIFCDSGFSDDSPT